MHQSDIDMYDAWMRGESIGAIAKKHKLDKNQVRRIVNRVVEERGIGTKAVFQLQGKEADKERQVSSNQ